MALATTASAPLIGTATGWTPIPAARFIASLDVSVVMTTLLLVLTGADRWSDGIPGFLSMRIRVGDIGLLVTFAAAVVAIFHAVSLYDAGRVRRFASEFGRVLISATGIAVLAAAVITSYAGVIDGSTLVHFWVATAAALTATHGVRAVVARSFTPCRRALIIGSGPHALRICRELSTDPVRTYHVVGFVDTTPAARSRFITRRTLGSLEELEAILAREHVDEVHVGLPVKSHYLEIQDTIRVCERLGVKLMYGADIFGTELARVRVERAPGTTPRVELQLVTDGFPLILKRLFDLSAASVALILLAPVMLITALAVKLTSEGPIIFAQERYGLNRSRFRMLKFRTMVPNAERLQAALEAQNESQGPMFKITRDPRITPIGRFLRRTSIDELPQLINVLRGEMSLIGPRPLPLRDVMKFTSTADLRRFSVRPGLTGLWQVSGRRCVDSQSWVTLDLHYIDRWSLGLDFTILLKTIPAVLRGTGAA